MDSMCLLYTLFFVYINLKGCQMIENQEVFEAVRRGYGDLSNATDDEVVDYFADIDDESWSGHMSNIKGVLFEQEYVDKLEEEGVEAALFEHTNHPDTDIQIFEDGSVVEELQLKATDSASYINSTLTENQDIAIVATTEVASGFDTNMVIDSGISDAVVEEAIVDSLVPVTPFGFGWGLLFGLPF